MNYIILFFMILSAQTTSKKKLKLPAQKYNTIIVSLTNKCIDENKTL